MNCNLPNLKVQEVFKSGLMYFLIPAKFKIWKDVHIRSLYLGKHIASTCFFFFKNQNCG